MVTGGFIAENPFRSVIGRHLGFLRRALPGTHFVNSLHGPDLAVRIQGGDLIGHCRNVRGLGKSMVVFRLFELLRCSNERSTKFEDLNHE